MLVNEVKEAGLRGCIFDAGIGALVSEMLAVSGTLE